MLGRFYILFSLLMTLVLVVGLHYIYSFSERAKELKSTDSLFSLTGMSEPSLSVAYYESRLLTEKHSDNPSYPSMQTIDKREYIYAK